MSLPPFPVDDGTLDLLSIALDPGEESERSSVGDFLEFMSQMGGSDTTAVDSVEWGDPLGMDESVEIHMMRDAAYHEHDIIRALVAEVRRLRPHGEPAHLVSAEWLEDVTSERDEARNAVRGMAARCWMLRQAARDSDSLARTVIAAREHHERHLRAQIATEIERHCLEDAFLEPDDLDNESKVCRYCHAAADIARGAA